MNSMQIKTAPSTGLELPSEWAANFYTTVDHIARFVDLPPQSLRRHDRVKQPKIQTRLSEIHALLRRIRPWFNSDQATWAWYIGEPLIAFGRLTPAEVVKHYQESGIEALNDWVTEREMAGFQ